MAHTSHLWSFLYTVDKLILNKSLVQFNVMHGSTGSTDIHEAPFGKKLFRFLACFRANLKLHFVQFNIQEISYMYTI